jgi:hypothetical protein
VQNFEQRASGAQPQKPKNPRAGLGVANCESHSCEGVGQNVFGGTRKERMRAIVAGNERQDCYDDYTEPAGKGAFVPFLLVAISRGPPNGPPKSCAADLRRACGHFAGDREALLRFANASSVPHPYDLTFWWRMPFGCLLQCNGVEHSVHSLPRRAPLRPHASSISPSDALQSRQRPSCDGPFCKMR